MPTPKSGAHAPGAGRKPVPAKKPVTGPGGNANFPQAQLQLLEQDDDKREFLAKAIKNNMVFFNMGVTPVKSDEELAERLNQFFMICAETQQIPSVEKMANCLGYHRQTLWDWETGRNKLGPNTSYIIKQAKQVLASIDAELAQEGKTQPVIYIFRAKNFYGMKEQQDVVLSPAKGPESPEDIARKYAELPED